MPRTVNMVEWSVETLARAGKTSTLMTLLAREPYFGVIAFIPGLSELCVDSGAAARIEWKQCRQPCPFQLVAITLQWKIFR